MVAFGALPTAAATAPVPVSSTQPSQFQPAFDVRGDDLAAAQVAFVQADSPDLIQPQEGVKATVSQGAIMPNAFMVTLEQDLAPGIPTGSKLTVQPTTVYPNGKVDAHVTQIDRYDALGGRETVAVPPGAMIVERKPGKALKAKRGGGGGLHSFASQMLIGAVAEVADQVTAVDETVLFGNNSTTVSRQSAGITPTTVGASVVKGGLTPIQQSLNTTDLNRPTRTATVAVVETHQRVSVTVTTPFSLGGAL